MTREDPRTVHKGWLAESRSVLREEPFSSMLQGWSEADKKDAARLLAAELANAYRWGTAVTDPNNR